MTGCCEGKSKRFCPSVKQDKPLQQEPFDTHPHSKSRAARVG